MLLMAVQMRFRDLVHVIRDFSWAEKFISECWHMSHDCDLAHRDESRQTFQALVLVKPFFRPLPMSPAELYILRH
jgi:hypothetical protein